HDRAVLVRQAVYLQLLVSANREPCPAAAEASCASLGEVFLELVKAAKLVVDGICQSTSRCAAAIRSDSFPEQGVVRVTAAIVANCAADSLRYTAQVSDQIFDRFSLQISVSFQRCVQVRHVSVVMASVVNLHRLRVDMRLQR